MKRPSCQYPNGEIEKATKLLCRMELHEKNTESVLFVNIVAAAHVIKTRDNVIRSPVT